eukprot:3653645-Alexandrium_andersonii.AAC.1
MRARARAARACAEGCACAGCARGRAGGSSFARPALVALSVPDSVREALLQPLKEKQVHPEHSDHFPDECVDSLLGLFAVSLLLRLLPPLLPQRSHGSIAGAVGVAAAAARATAAGAVT